MITVDVQQLVYLTIPSEFTDLSRRVFNRDPIWAAPGIWESEFRSAALQYIRAGLISPEAAILAFEGARAVVGEHILPVEFTDVVALGTEWPKLSSYDLEYVVAAESARCALITSDRKVLQAFPDVAVHPQAFVTNG